MSAVPMPPPPPRPATQGKGRGFLRAMLKLLVFFAGGALVGAGAAYSGLTLLPDVGLVGLAVFFIAMWPNLVLHAELAMLEGDADAARTSVEAARGTLERVHDATGVLLLEEYFLALEGQMPNPAVAAAGDPTTA